MYRFLERRKTNGNNTIKEITIAKNDSSIVVLKKTNETINAAIPTATFNP